MDCTTRAAALDRRTLLNNVCAPPVSVKQKTRRVEAKDDGPLALGRFCGRVEKAVLIVMEEMTAKETRNLMEEVD